MFVLPRVVPEADCRGRARGRQRRRNALQTQHITLNQDSVRNSIALHRRADITQTGLKRIKLKKKIASKFNCYKTID